MSDVNTQISLFQVEFSRHYLSLIGCISSVKTLLVSVGVSQVCSPLFSTVKLLFFRKYKNFMTFREEVYEFDHFVRMVSSVFIAHRSAGCWERKYVWFDLEYVSTLLSYISKFIKALYSVRSGNNWCSISSKIDIVRVLIHEFLSTSNSYYEMKCCTVNLMGEHHYPFYVDCCNPCFKYT